METIVSQFHKFKYSFAIKIRDEVVNKNGESPIILRVIIERRKKDISLNLSWPSSRFDKIGEILLPKYKNDPDLNDYNILINSAKTQANEIFKFYRLRNKTLDVSQFVNDFKNKASLDSFPEYYLRKLTEQYKDGLISSGTYKSHLQSLNRLNRFLIFQKIQLPFSEITAEFLNKYSNWIRKKDGCGYNTMMGALKHVRKYVNMAQAEGHRFEYAFKEVHISFRDGIRCALEVEEVQKFKELYNSALITGNQKLVLQKFLFSCYTGLRISDSKNLQWSMMFNDELRVPMIKGEKFGKTVTIPLIDYAKELLGKPARGYIFNSISEKETNEQLKTLASMAGINKHISFHVARDTFGTLYIELGGDIVTLKDIMGHSSISTTMIYQKISERRKQKQMANFNKI